MMRKKLSRGCDGNDEDDGECPICLEIKKLCNIKSIDKKCTHQICRECFTNLQTPKTCPLCRRQIKSIECNGTVDTSQQTVDTTQQTVDTSQQTVDTTRENVIRNILDILEGNFQFQETNYSKLQFHCQQLTDLSVMRHYKTLLNNYLVTVPTNVPLKVDLYFVGTEYKFIISAKT
jgi:hypothetical protein